MDLVDGSDLDAGRHALGDAVDGEVVGGDDEEVGGRLAENEVVAISILLLNAGHEATVNVIGAGLGPLAVALVTARVLADAHRIHLAMSWVAAAATPVVIAAFLLALRGHAAAARAVAASA